MESYSEDDTLQLSGIQHYVFCPRQWALIALDMVWTDNLFTAEGSLLHDKVDNPFLREKNVGNKFTLRGVRLYSSTLGFSGIADAVEILPEEGVSCNKRELLKSGKFKAIPIEYKRGHRKINDCDRMQVAAQAMTLEEMLGIYIGQGAVFYWEERLREYFDITSDLRNKVKMAAKEMHEIFKSKRLPDANMSRVCRQCSLVDDCIPTMSSNGAKSYINGVIKNINEETS